MAVETALKFRPPETVESDSPEIGELEGEKADQNELTPEKRAQIIEWSRDWLEKRYQRLRIDDDNMESSLDRRAESDSAETASKYVRQIMHELRTMFRELFFKDVADQVDSDCGETGLITPQLRAGMGIFIEQLIGFIKHKYRDSATSERVDKFLDKIEPLFEGSESIASILNADDALIAISKMTRGPNKLAKIGGRMIHNLVPKLNYQGSGKEILERLKDMSVVNTIDVVNQLQTVGATAIGQGWFLALESSRTTLENLKKSHPSPLVVHSCELALERLEQESESPSLGFATRLSPSEVRIKEDVGDRINEQNQELTHQIRSDRLLNRDDKMAFTAKDAVAVYDHSGFPRQVARIEKNVLPEKSKFDYVSLKNAQEITANPEEYRIDLIEFVRKFSTNFLSKDKDIDTADDKSLAAELAQITDTLDESEWLEYLQLGAEKAAWDRQYYQQKLELDQSTDAQSEQASQVYLDKFAELAPKIISEYRGDRRLEQLEYAYNQYLKYSSDKEQGVNHINAEQAYRAAEDFVMLFKAERYLSLEGKVSKSKYSETVQEILTAEEELHQQHTYYRETAGQELLKFVDSIVPKEKEARLLSLLNSLQSQSDNFFGDLQGYLADLENRIKDDFCPAHFVDYEDIPQDPTLNPFPEGSKNENLPLLLQDLHNPAMREKINEDLGFDITELPLNSQIHLLRYLASRDSEEYHKLQIELKRHPVETKKEMLMTFLSCSYGLEYGDVILDIATADNEQINESQKEAIFKEYNLLNEQALKIGEIIKNSSFFDEIDLPPEISGMFVEQLAEAVMRRAKDMLNTAQAIALRGEAKAIFYNQREMSCDDPKEIIKALQVYRVTLEKLGSLLEPDNTNNKYSYELIGKDQAQVPETYEFRVYDQVSEKVSYLTLQLREQGAVFGEHNEVMEFDGEARINVLVHDQPIGRTLNEQSRQDAFSLRLDREGRTRKEGEVVSNDPTQTSGELSLDVGFLGQQKSSLAGDVVGRVIAIGNALGSERGKGRVATDYPEFYHNRESFAQVLGGAETFAKIVQFIRQELEQWSVSVEAQAA